MPTQTFFNLPEAKRRAILDIALDEFAHHDYRNASISRIVARAGIAKGSLYQYFEDKKDLFLYLVNLAQEEKMAFLQSLTPPDAQMGFFPYLRWLVKTAVGFQLSDPRLGKVAYRALYGDLPFRDEMLARVREASREYVRALIQQGMARGDLNAGINLDLAVFVVGTVLAELGNYLVAEQRIDLGPMAEGGRPTFNQEELERIYDQVLEILSHGLSARPAPAG